MNEINYFKVFIICSDDVTADVDHLHVKRTHLVDFSYIVIEDAFKIIANFSVPSEFSIANVIILSMPLF
jgi:hypothetical protein